MNVIQLAHSLDPAICWAGWLAGSFFITLMRTVTAVELSAPVALSCLRVCDYLAIQTVTQYDPTKEKALLSAHPEREKNAKRVSSKHVPIVLFHQPHSLSDSCLFPSHPSYTFVPLFSPPLGLISRELRSQLKMKMNNSSYTFCLQHWELGYRHHG